MSPAAPRRYCCSRPNAPLLLLAAERAAVVALRREGRIADEVMQRVQRDLELEEPRLDA